MKEENQEVTNYFVKNQEICDIIIMEILVHVYYRLSKKERNLEYFRKNYEKILKKYKFVKKDEFDKITKK